MWTQFKCLSNAVIVEVEYAANRFGDLSGFATYQAPTVPWYNHDVLDFREIALQARAAWKRLSSTFKTEWAIEDYPIEVQSHRILTASPAFRHEPFPWTARAINWPGMLGGGDTRQEAVENLRKCFEQFKASKKDLPRPGTRVPIQFAANTRVNQHTKLAKDFAKRVLGVEWAWISDESSLSDFSDEGTNDRLVQQIRTVYGVDVSDIPSGNLADILDRIAQIADFSG